jgi:hypothetical protein
MFDSHETSGVAAWPRQPVGEAGGDRIASDREHDRHSARLLHDRTHGRDAMGQDYVGCERGQLRCVSANLGDVGRGPARVNPHVAADGPTQLLQSLQERSDTGLKFQIVRGCGQENADSPYPLALLRTRRERPDGRRAA